MKTAYVTNTELLISLDNIHTTVKKYREENSVNEKIKAILAVGVKYKLIKGFLQKELLKDDEMRKLEKKFKEFE